MQLSPPNLKCWNMLLLVLRLAPIFPQLVQVSTRPIFQPQPRWQVRLQTGQIYFETLAGQVYLVSGAGCGINKLGVRTSLDDASIPNPLPKFTSTYGDSDKLNGNGYSLPGASDLCLGIKYMFWHVRMLRIVRNPDTT